MQAYHFMLFFMIFNFSVSMVGALYIYPPPIEEGGTNVDDASQDYDVTLSQHDTTVNSILGMFAGPTLMSGLLSGIMVAALASFLTRVPTVAAISYGIFGGVFWGFFTSAFTVFFKIVDSFKFEDGTVNLGISSIVWVFGIIVFIVFLAGFMQLLSGGWKAIE